MLEREREARNIDMREKYGSVSSHTHPARNQTLCLLVYRTTLQHLSHEARVAKLPLNLSTPSKVAENWHSCQKSK